MFEWWTTKNNCCVHFPHKVINGFHTALKTRMFVTKCNQFSTRTRAGVDGNHRLTSKPVAVAFRACVTATRANQHGLGKCHNYKASGSGLFLFFLASCGYIRCWGTTTEKQPNQFSSQGKQSTFHMTFVSPLTFQICPRSPLSRRLSSSALNKRVGVESRGMITSGADTGVRERKMATSQV